MNSKRNPLFVVTKKGKIVEQADNFIDALIKKIGLTPAIEVIKNLIQMALETTKGYVSIVLVDQILALWSQILMAVQNLFGKRNSNVPSA